LERVVIHTVEDRHEIPADQPARLGLRLPMQAAPIDRTPTAAALNTSAGVGASAWGLPDWVPVPDPCDLLSGKAKQICKGLT